ncbi:hypothetical protein [Burkholderia cenocepacia]|uniref:hypothetical protein n=1 Tax=Burkholderia cenocepacia TaxID=95486 RepID=UPI001EF2CF52|nr:hypothetical protein [Burkholderia cenocepacia]
MFVSNRIHQISDANGPWSLVSITIAPRSDSAMPRIAPVPSVASMRVSVAVTVQPLCRAGGRGDDGAASGRAGLPVTALVPVPVGTAPPAAPTPRLGAPSSCEPRPSIHGSAAAPTITAIHK